MQKKMFSRWISKIENFIFTTRVLKTDLFPGEKVAFYDFSPPFRQIILPKNKSAIFWLQKLSQGNFLLIWNFKPKTSWLFIKIIFSRLRKKILSSFISYILSIFQPRPFTLIKNLRASMREANVLSFKTVQK